MTITCAKAHRPYPAPVVRVWKNCFQSPRKHHQLLRNKLPQGYHRPLMFLKHVTAAPGECLVKGCITTYTRVDLIVHEMLVCNRVSEF